MEYLFVTLGLILWGVKSNMFKVALDGKNTLNLTTLYFLAQSLGMTLIGAFLTDGSIITVFNMPYFYVLLLMEFLSGIGMGILFNRSNATFTIGIISAASMLASLYYSSFNIFIIILMIAAVGCLFFYFKKTNIRKMTFPDYILSILILFVPTLFHSIYIPTITKDFGNAMAIFGLARLIPFLILSFFKLKKQRLDIHAKTVLLSAAISVTGHLLIFYGFSITQSNSILLFLLSFEALLTEIAAYCFGKNQIKLNLGQKTPIQFVGILMFCVFAALSIVILHSQA